MEIELRENAQMSGLLRLFGPLEGFWEDQTSFLPRGRRERALLAILALAGGRPVPRSVLVELLWGDRARTQAYSSLRQSLHELRNALGPSWGEALGVERDGVALRTGSMWVDAVAVQSQVSDIPELIELVRGPLLGELRGLSTNLDEWIDAEWRRLAAVVRYRADLLFATLPSQKLAIRLAETALAFDPTYRHAWKALIAAHASMGNRASALKAFARFAAAAPGFGSPVDLEAELNEMLAAIGSGVPNDRGMAARTEDRTPLPASGVSGPRIAIGEFHAAENVEADIALQIGWWFDEALCRIGLLGQTALGGCDRAPSPHLSSWGDCDFLLEGSVRTRLGAVHVDLRLRELRGEAEPCWSECTAFSNSAPFIMRREIAATIAPCIAAEAAKHRNIAKGQLPKRCYSVPGLVILAATSVRGLDLTHFTDAKRILSEAARCDPRDPHALAWLTHCHVLSLGQGWTKEVDATRTLVAELVARLLALDPRDASLLAIAGHALSYTLRRVDEGLSLQDRVLSTNPLTPSALLYSGLAHAYAGDHAEAVRRIERARALSPFDEQDYFMDMALSLALFLRGDCEDALLASRRSEALNPRFSSTLKVSLAAQGVARGAGPLLLRRLLRLEPSLTVERFLSMTPLLRTEDRKRFADGLRLGGLTNK
jgi:DNA-binding SARP family transcriptional activator